MMKRRIFTMVIAGSLLLGSYPSATAEANAQSAPASDKFAQQSIGVLWNGSNLTLSHPPVIKGGRILVPLRDLAAQFGALVRWDGGSKTVTIVHPESFIAFVRGSKSYTLNGNKGAFDVAPTTVNGVTYVPLRFFSTLMNADIQWSGAKKTVKISYSDKLLLTTAGNTTVWLNMDTRTLYYSTGYNAPVAIPGAVQELKGGWGTVFLQAEKLEGSLLVHILDNYGEPHINDQLTKLIVKDGSIVATSTVLYRYDLDNDQSVSTYNGQAVMLNQAEMRLVMADGKVAASYDLGKITGLDDVFTVEAVFEDYLLVRTHKTRMLIGIQLSTMEYVHLYKQLFSAEEQQTLEQWPTMEIDYPGDQLSLLHREDNVLTFKREQVKGYYGGGWAELTASYTIPQK